MLKFEGGKGKLWNVDESILYRFMEFKKKDFLNYNVHNSFPSFSNGFKTSVSTSPGKTNYYILFISEVLVQCFV